MKKKIGKIFDFSGLNIYLKIGKALVLVVILFFVYKGFMWSWETVASLEPSTKKKINSLYGTIILTQDSLKIAQNQVVVLSNESVQKDSIIESQKTDIDISKSNERKLQSLLLELSRQNKSYKDNGAYFIYDNALLKRNRKLRVSTKAEVDSLLSNQYDK